MSRKDGVDKARWLGHVDAFIEITMMECILDIKLAKDTSARESKRKNNTNACRFDHWAKSVMIINAFLVKSLSNKTSFVGSSVPSALRLIR